MSATTTCRTLLLPVAVVAALSLVLAAPVASAAEDEPGAVTPAAADLDLLVTSVEVAAAVDITAAESRIEVVDGTVEWTVIWRNTGDQPGPDFGLYTVLPDPADGRGTRSAGVLRLVGYERLGAAVRQPAARLLFTPDPIESLSAPPASNSLWVDDFNVTELGYPLADSSAARLSVAAGIEPGGWAGMRLVFEAEGHEVGDQWVFSVFVGAWGWAESVEVGPSPVRVVAATLIGSAWQESTTGERSALVDLAVELSGPDGITRAGVVSDQAGGFGWDELISGEYHLLVRDLALIAEGWTATHPDGMPGPEGTLLPITVARGETVTVDLSYRAPAAVPDPDPDPDPAPVPAPEPELPFRSEVSAVPVPVVVPATATTLAHTGVATVPLTLLGAVGIALGALLLSVRGRVHRR